MKKPSSITLITAGILASVVSVVPMTLPAAAQNTSGTTDNQTTGTTGTTSTYQEPQRDYSGLWGLAGLFGLFGLAGRRKDVRDNEPVSRDYTTR
jgi:MYXO-CTERM domain-containing protein